ncbi:hypothetical protein EVAR_35314_1 [Eumeta japonica]|uniref:Uncharacterized protein n=1 Tax=Eumeta variegata TaxID=151549 RepID=A0A4C1XLP2_EUMVA|nr:hypothetical protein EVAR_35314_1 [Eumeta japonica]
MRFEVPRSRAPAATAARIKLAQKQRPYVFSKENKCIRRRDRAAPATRGLFVREPAGAARLIDLPLTSSVCFEVLNFVSPIQSRLSHVGAPSAAASFPFPQVFSPVSALRPSAFA